MAKRVENITPEVKEEIKEIKDTQVKQAGPSYEELLSLVQSLANEVETLKSGKETNSNTVSSGNDMREILALMANRKADKEVSIVHNSELAGGLTTHIDLSTVSIDFSHVGETRLLNWQQFEECVSKYRSFFDRRIILLGADYIEEAKKYNLPCIADSTGKHMLTQDDIAKLSKLSAADLEKFIETLDDSDKEIVFSYWLGKCYKREPEFYDRYKMDTLNRLSNGAFANILLVMNGEVNVDNK